MNHYTINWEKVITIHQFDEEENTTFLQNHGGIYLWVAKTTPKRVVYIGETTNYWNRFCGWNGHIVHQIGGISTTRDYKQFKHKDFIEAYKDEARGHVNRSNDALSDEHPFFQPTMPAGRSVSKTFLNKDHIMRCLQSLGEMEYCFGTFDQSKDRVHRRRLEGIFNRSLVTMYESIAKEKKLPAEPVIDLGRCYFPNGDNHIEHIGKALNDIPPEVIEIGKWLGN